MTVAINPFHQTSVTYSLELQVVYKALPKFLEFCDSLSDSIVYFEAEDSKTIDSKPEDLWQINIYLDEYPNLELLKKTFEEIASSLSISRPQLNLVKVNDIDWVSEVQKTFVPINSGKFFIHSSDFQDNIPSDAIKIEINAGRAFGTGEHETTNNCLKALSNLEVEKFKIALDMGCGSGILAIAMAKLNIPKIIAVDLDLQAVLVTEDNAKLNNVNNILVGQSNGYGSNLVQENARYDLITANILASPLISMAGEAAKCLNKQGIIILSGFLADQVKDVLRAYEEEGLELIDQIYIENWPTLVMQKIT